jgi:hypothetical protein
MLNARRHWIGADPINLFFKRGIFIWPLLAEPENGSTRHFAPILLSDPSSSDHRRSVTPAAIAGGTRKILCSLTGRSMGSSSLPQGRGGGMLVMPTVFNCLGPKRLHNS